MEPILNSFKDKKGYIIFSILLFAAGAVIGYFAFKQDPEFILSNLNNLMGNIINIGKQIMGKKKLYAIGLIFQNNVKALLLMMFGGIFLGIIPLIGMIFNGLLIGIMLAMVFYEGKTLAFFLATLLPHGILELPVIILGASFGLKTGFEIIIPNKNKNRMENLKENLTKSVLSMGVLVPLLYIAAVIETLITPYFAKLF
ncbi:stage II sporulation protein M [Thermovenabulum sp.]|uniref:stage II sporulation protein M n=1 Tax=Thermovenabulum sp. TaxID=3100335 RepID=UPI003C7DB30F